MSAIIGNAVVLEKVFGKPQGDAAVVKNEEVLRIASQEKSD